MHRRTVVAIWAGLLVAGGLVGTAMVAFPAGTVGRVSAGPMRLPVTLEGPVLGYCMPDRSGLFAAVEAAKDATNRPTGSPLYLSFSTSGSGRSFSATVEAPGDWRVRADRSGVTVSRDAGGGAGAVATPVPHEAVSVAQQLYSCESRYRFVDETGSLASSSQLVQWYKYDTAVLWPCLAAHGVDAGDPPTREDFSDPFRAQTVDPYHGLTLSRHTLGQVLAAARDCPLRPSFLR